MEENWYSNPDSLRAEVAKHGSMAAAARAHGVSPSTVHSQASKLGVRFPKSTPIVGEPVAAELPDDQAVLSALKQAGDGGTVEQIADLADMSPKRVREALERLGHDGYRVQASDEGVRLERIPTETGERHQFSPKLFDGDTLRFGVVSDTHLGSSAQRPEAIEAAYDVFVQEGIVDVFHVGDLVDGLDIYKNHNTEVLLHTYEAQVDHAADVYPVRDTITTRLIGGNHDLEGSFGRAGADPVQAVVNRRPDMEYLGRYSAWVDLPNGATMQLLHPQGGASYATSYRPQKIAESYEAGSKPNILLIGHWHRTGYFPVRGIQTMLAGTFQGPTTFSTRKGMGEAGWGFWIVQCTLAADGSVVRFTPTWHPFYPGRTVT